MSCPKGVYRHSLVQFKPKGVWKTLSGRLACKVLKKL